MIRRIPGWLHRVKDAAVTVMFMFWCCQFVGWMGMMCYVQFINPKLGNNILYVTQISHWALVEAAGTAAISSWALLQARHTQRHVQRLDAKRHGEPVGQTTTSPSGDAW